MGVNQCKQCCQEGSFLTKAYDDSQYHQSRQSSPEKGGSSSLLMMRQQFQTPNELLEYLQTLLASNPVYDCLLDQSLVVRMLERVSQTCATPEQSSCVAGLAASYIKKSLQYRAYEDSPNLQEFQLFMNEMGRRYYKMDQQMTSFNKGVQQIRDYVIEDNLPSTIEAKHFLHDLKYDFEETDQVAQQVKELCKVDARAFALLTNFFIKCCQGLEKKGRRVKQIEPGYKRLVSALARRHFPKNRAPKSIEKTKSEPAGRTRSSSQTSNGLENLQSLSPEQRRLKVHKLIKSTLESIEPSFLKVKALVSDSCFRYGSRLNFNVNSYLNGLQGLQYAIKREIIEEAGQSSLISFIKKGENQSIENITGSVSNELKQRVDEVLGHITSIPSSIETQIISVSCLFSSHQDQVQCFRQIKKKALQDDEFKITEMSNEAQKPQTMSELSMSIGIKGIVIRLTLTIEDFHNQQQFWELLSSLEEQSYLSPLATLRQVNSQLTPGLMNLVHQTIEKNSSSNRQRNMDLQTLQNVKEMFGIEKNSTTWVDDRRFLSYFQDTKNILKETLSLRGVSQPVKKQLRFYNTFYLLMAQQRHKQVIQSLTELAKAQNQTLKLENVQESDVQIFALMKLYPDQAILASLLFGVGDCYSSQGQYENGLKFYLKSLEITQKAAGKDTMESIPKINKIASIYYAHGMNKEAISYFLRGLKVVEQLKGEVSMESVSQLKNLGMVHDSQGQSEEALKYYEKCLKLTESIKGKESIQSVRTLNIIGMVHKGQGSYKQALKYFQSCLTIVEKVKGKDSPDCAMPLNNIAMAHDSLGNHTQALKCEQRCLRILESTKGKDSIECTLPLNNIASVYYSQRRYNEALRFYQRCFEIQQRVKGIDSIECASTLNNIASVYDAVGNYESALKCYQKCLSIEERVKGKDAIQCASTLNNIGMAYDGQGRYEEALEVYERCLKIKSNAKGKDNIGEASTLNNIASVYYAQSKMKEALTFYEKSLTILEKSQDQGSVTFLSTLKNIGSVHYAQSNYPQALKVFKRALKIKEKVKGRESIEYSATLSNIGMTYFAMGNYGNALSHYEQCLKIQERVKGKDAYECALTLNSIGTIYKGKGNFSQSLKFLQRCLSVKEKSQASGSSKYSELLRSAQMGFEGDGNYKQALACFQRSLKIETQVKGGESKECASTLENIAVVLLELGKIEPATKCFEQARRIVQLHTK